MIDDLFYLPELEQIDDVKVQWQPRLFMDYVKPNGWLEKDTTCHGLFFYYLMARKAYEDNIKDPIFIEGDIDLEVNFRQLFTSIARLYGTRPERMVRFWSHVDMQVMALKLPKLPEQYKFNSEIRVKTNGKR